MKRAEVITKVLQADIQNVLIGGLAVKAHGSSRTTVDLDMAARVVDADKIIDCMYGLGYRLPTSTHTESDGSQVILWAQTPKVAKGFTEYNKSGALNFYMMDPDDPKRILDQVDFVFENPVPFARLMAKATQISENPVIRVACVEHLILMKEKRIKEDKAGPNDFLDLEFLKVLRKNELQKESEHDPR